MYRRILLLHCFLMLPVVLFAAPKADKDKVQTGSRTIIYHLYVGDTVVNYSGKTKKAIAINGSIPAPTLYFTEGDTAVVYVHNTLKVETSIHWHGLILPNEQDGVPYLTSAPIAAGTTRIYKFPIVQSGTYWYHSHTMLQEQSGMYGALIIHKRNEPIQNEHTVVLSDWTDESPDEVHRSLHMATDWYAIKKNAVQSYAEAIKADHFSTKLTNEWKRMHAMDVSDVYYDAFLINGKKAEALSDYKAGDKIRLRIVNGASSTYFWLNYSFGKITVVANDGMDVVPVEVDRLMIAVAETYDVMVTIPENGQHEFLATAEDRSSSVSLWLGEGEKHHQPPLKQLKYFEGMDMMNAMMKMNGSMDDMGMEMSLQQMDMNAVMYPEIGGQNPKLTTLNYSMLRSPVKTTLPAGKLKELRFELTGNMNRYVWSINNKTVSEADKILIKKGENVRIVLTNNSMMRHPMHLHGHFFSVLNGQDEYSPLKNTLDIMPMETDTIEFAATESGDWFFHCHILYHMMSGMGRIFSYENSPPNLQLPDPVKALKKVYAEDRKWHAMFNVGLETNGSDGEAGLMNTRYRLMANWHAGFNEHNGYELEVNFGRYLGKMQWFLPYVGWQWRDRDMMHAEKNLFGQINTKDSRQTFHAGFQYTLPLLFVADAAVDLKGNVRFQLMREDIPITKRVRMSLMANTDKEYMAGMRYILSKYLNLSTHYDSDMGWGAGIAITY